MSELEYLAEWASKKLCEIATVKTKRSYCLLPNEHSDKKYPDGKVRGANMAPTCILSATDGPHVGPKNLAIRVYTYL